MREILSYALGGAVAAALILPAPVQATSVTLVASLDGGAGGDAAGGGTFSAEADAEAGDLCYMLSVTGLANVAAAHIHEGAAGQEGKPVVSIGITAEGQNQCVAVESDQLKALIAAPANYYVNVHTREYPRGAVRGQLSQKAE